MMQRRQQGETPSTREGRQSQRPTMAPEDFQLREGLTVTVSIIVDEKNSVLLVPTRTITRQGRQAYVQVLAANGALEQRAIQTGISDFQFTEVTEGLSEGEEIVVPNSTATRPTTSTSSVSGQIRRMFR